MTQNTEQERALYECISCNNLYGVTPSACDCCENPKNEYREWVALPKEQAARRAQVVSQEPAFESQAFGLHGPTGPITKFYAAAPQPPEGLMSEKRTTKPEAAPVQMPEPEATVYSKLGTTCMFPSSVMRKGDKIFTEQQVRQLLAAKDCK